jgi:hypothetical protein
MPAIVSATVMRWAVDKSGPMPIVSYVSSTPISMYVGDGPATDPLQIIGQYALSAGGDLKDLLGALRDGLLQVTNVTRVPITPPPVPPSPSTSAGAPPATGSKSA